MAFPPRAPRGAFNPRFKKEQQQEHRTNHMIRVPEVRLVGENIEPGIYSFADAQKMAQDQQLDLVEISPGATPPVCKIIDYNKFLYDEKKKKKEMKAKSKTSEVKEVRFTPNTDDHDFEFKCKHAEKFLQDGNKVKAHVQFKGRAIMFKERGELLLLKEENTSKEGEQDVVETIEYKDYKKVGAILLPFEVTRNAGGQEFTVKYSDFKLNEGVSETEFK